MGELLAYNGKYLSLSDEYMINAEYYDDDVNSPTYEQNVYLIIRLNTRNEVIFSKRIYIPSNEDGGDEIMGCYVTEDEEHIYCFIGINDEDSDYMGVVVMKTSNLDIVGVISSSTKRSIRYFYMKTLSRVYVGF